MKGKRRKWLSRVSVNTVPVGIKRNMSSGLIHPDFKLFLWQKTFLTQVDLQAEALRRLYNICWASLTVLQSTLDCHLFSLLPVAPVFQCFQFINLYHCFLSFPLYSLPFTLPMCFVYVLFRVYFPSILFLSICFYFCPSMFFTLLPSFLLHPLSSFGHTLFPIKNTKSRGSKHKSRRKSKKQKRPSTVCNSLT